MADWQAALTYIDSYWPTLIRENRSDSRTLIGLPHPYVAPAEAVGQRMFQEMYYWDSFFTALGLFGTPHAGLIAGMAENMAALYRRFGVIPNASRFYFRR
jgi:alpha,alpha-trehalase